MLALTVLLPPDDLQSGSSTGPAKVALRVGYVVAQRLMPLPRETEKAEGGVYRPWHVALPSQVVGITGCRIVRMAVPVGCARESISGRPLQMVSMFPQASPTEPLCLTFDAWHAMPNLARN